MAKMALHRRKASVSYASTHAHERLLVKITKRVDSTYAHAERHTIDDLGGEVITLYFKIANLSCPLIAII
jgi:hypothetical protein